MRRIRVGDKVCAYNHMNRIGTVLEVYTKKSDTWMVGGAMSQTLYMKVTFENGIVEERLYSDMLLQE